MLLCCYRIWKLDLVTTPKGEENRRFIPSHDELKLSAEGRNRKASRKSKLTASPSTSPLHQEAAVFVSELRACAKTKDLLRGVKLHDDVVKQGLLEKCSDALVSMYAKCGELAKAKSVLDIVQSSNVFSWTALISAYTQHGRALDALSFFDEFLAEGLSPNSMTYTSILKSCGDLKDVKRGEQIHRDVARQGLLESDVLLSNALVHMYVKCGALSKAEQVLENLSCHDVASWSALIAGYAQTGQDRQAYSCFKKLQSKGLSPDSMILSCMSKVCGNLKALKKGCEIHNEISRRGLLANDAVLGNSLVSMYIKCGDLLRAQKLHEELPMRDAVSWNILIGGLTEHGDGAKAISCFDQMQLEGICPDQVTVTCILQACGSIGDIDKGEQLHELIGRQRSLNNNVVIGTALVDMYTKCGALAKAHEVLKELPSRDILTWTALIAGYVEHGQGALALQSFEQMEQEGFSPDAVIFTCILRACGMLEAFDKGKMIHEKISETGLLEKNIVLGNALLDLYVKDGALDKAQTVLEELPCRDVVSWTTLIAGLVEHDHNAKALEYFDRMQQEGLSPNAVTYACILKACGAIGLINMGKKLHDEIIQQGLLSNQFELGTALVDMYAKCGALMKAEEVVENLPFQYVGPWNALITSYAQQGHGKKALDCFQRMRGKGIHPDGLTYLAVINACNHLGLVEDFFKQFFSITAISTVKPNLEHLTSIVDLLGRSGHIDKVVGLIQEFPYLNDIAVWHSLLGACQKWGDVSVGRWAFDQAVQLDKHDSVPYILMTSIYAGAGMYKDAKSVEAMRTGN